MTLPPSIKPPNPGNGIPEDKTGYNEWENFTRIADTFKNPINAASRVVGTKNKDLAEFGTQGLANTGLAGTNLPANNGASTLDDYIDGFQVTGVFTYALPPTPVSRYGIALVGVSYNGGTTAVLNIDAEAKDNTIVYKTSSGKTSVSVLYCDKNTTVDPNGFIKKASPIVDLYDDGFELNSDASQQEITVTKNDIGDYTIKTDTGLRKDGWDIALPWDTNNNPLFAVVAEANEDGTVNIKCYRRIFSMQNFTFGPDLDNPMDIPKGRFMQLRLNDNPVDETTDVK